ncbi:hypothetical protein B0J11DRAFT_573951 [Dendryphion nanum]|uniref:Uncharacterized protein n=1 Tax=Dendryphion nanum TaxID=256645 RepID=A0A9P9EHI6_9PLEO|nr:hypothetical protein B0J11DRAFT_573951 [Dendryphion nanum]
MSFPTPHTTDALKQAVVDIYQEILDRPGQLTDKEKGRLSFSLELCSKTLRSWNFVRPLHQDARIYKFFSHTLIPGRKLSWDDPDHEKGLTVIMFRLLNWALWEYGFGQADLLDGIGRHGGSFMVVRFQKEGRINRNAIPNWLCIKGLGVGDVVGLDLGYYGDMKGLQTLEAEDEENDSAKREEFENVRVEEEKGEDDNIEKQKVE